MARFFDNVDDEIYTAIGDCDFASSDGSSFGGIVRMADNGVYRGWASLNQSAGAGGATCLSLGRNNVNQLWSRNQVDITSTLTIQTTDGWCLVGVSKPGGTAQQATFYKIPMEGLSASTNTPATTGNNYVQPDANGVVHFAGGGDKLNGDIAIWGCWNRVLTQAEWEKLTISLQWWYASLPKGLWLFDQDAVSQKLVDLTGGGANESSIVGSAVTTASVPTFSYGFTEPLLTESTVWSPPANEGILMVTHSPGYW